MAKAEAKAKSWYNVESNLFAQHQNSKDIHSLVIQFARNRYGHVESNEQCYEITLELMMGFPGYLRVIQPSGDCFLIQNQSKPSFKILSCTFDTGVRSRPAIRVLLEFACATRSTTYSHVFKPPKILNH